MSTSETVAESATVNTTEDMLKPAEVAALLNVDPRTVTRWARQGRLAHVLTPGGHRRYPRSAIDAMKVERNTTDVAAD